MISSPDKIIFFKEGEGSNRNMFYFFKEAEDGTYNLMEIYSDRKGNLTAKTFYKTRKGSKQRVIDIEKSLLLTSEASLVHPLSGAKIPQMFETTTHEEEISTNDEVSEVEHRSINPTIIIWYNRTFKSPPITPMLSIQNAQKNADSHERNCKTNLKTNREPLKLIKIE